MSSCFRKYRPLFFFACSFLVGLLSPSHLSIPSSLLDTLYTVLGISFSLSVSHTLGVDFSQIQNTNLRKRLMKNSRKLFASVVFMFVLATISFVLSSLFNEHNVKIQWFNLDCFALSMLLLSLAYTSINFLETARLKNEIIDRVAEGK